MRAPVFVGDEVSAAGFRLAGARVMVPAAGAELAVFQQARSEADLLLLTAQVAERLPNGVMDAALLDVTPLILIVPDIRGILQPPDIASRLRRQLGLAE